MDIGNCESQGIDSLMQICYDSGEILSSASSLTITGLLGDTDIEYELITRFIDDTTVGDYKLTFNADTGANYGYQDITGINADKAAARDTSEAYWHIGQTSTDDYHCFGITKIYAKSGYVRTGISKYAYDITGTTVTGIVLRGHAWSGTAAEITSMTITPTADKINVGSRIILLRKVTSTNAMSVGQMNVKGIMKYAWQEVYKTTLAAAAANVSISGLKGDTDVLYRIRCRFVDDDTTGGYYMTINADTSTYGYQYLDGANTVVSAVRDTSEAQMMIGYTNTDGNICDSETILYAKSGFIRPAITNYAGDIVTTTVTNVRLLGQSYDDTATEITSLEIGAVADKMNIGTVLIVERLNL
jgi:hypothetical protein